MSRVRRTPGFSMNQLIYCEGKVDTRRIQRDDGAGLQE